jgi:hypothetical protein
MTRILLAFPALFALAACEVPAEVPADPAPDADACGASGLQDIVGQEASVLAAMLFPQPMRVIRPGDMVTMDFQPGRLNIDVDAQERISRVYCG